MTTATCSTHRPDPGWHDADDLKWAVRRWAARMGVEARSIHIRPLTTKWASLSTNGRLTLDSGLLTLPQRLGELVIVHELAHLLMPNHGRVFKAFMDAYLPDWQERERELRGAVGDDAHQDSATQRRPPLSAAPRR
jgi:predicted metal-dependent hydrolase